MSFFNIFRKKEDLGFKVFYLQNRLSVAEAKLNELLSQNKALKYKCEELQDERKELEAKCEELQSQKDEAEAIFNDLSFTEKARLIAYGSAN